MPDMASKNDAMHVTDWLVFCELTSFQEAIPCVKKLAIFLPKAACLTSANNASVFNNYKDLTELIFFTHVHIHQCWMWLKIVCLKNYLDVDCIFSQHNLFWFKVLWYRFQNKWLNFSKSMFQYIPITIFYIYIQVYVFLIQSKYVEWLCKNTESKAQW